MIQALTEPTSLRLHTHCDADVAVEKFTPPTVAPRGTAVPAHFSKMLLALGLYFGTPRGQALK
ncbi:MAG: hypothetical protein N2512_03795, partial [Armatimonadetes bacterium]|nr:hypothetical protein [Armatimonadota bacterium]